MIKVQYKGRLIDSYASYKDFLAGKKRDNAIRQKIPLQCLECGSSFSKNLGPNSVNSVKCPKCKSYDIDLK